MRIIFDTDNAAFGYDDDNNFALQAEITRILEDICNKVNMGEICGSIIDINGNKVGSWEID